MKLEIKNLSKKFGKKEVLKNIDYTFDQGIVYALLGRNGAGKTTLFSLISEQIKKDSGNIYLIDENEKKELDFRDVFFMVAEPDLPKFLTGYEFIKFFLEANKENIKNEKSIYMDLYMHKMDLTMIKWGERLTVSFLVTKKGNKNIKKYIKDVEDAFWFED